MKITAVSDTGDEVSFSRDTDDPAKARDDVTGDKTSSLPSSEHVPKNRDGSLNPATPPLEVSGDGTTLASKPASNEAAELPILQNVFARVYLAPESEQSDDDKTKDTAQDSTSLRIGSVFSLNEDQKKEFFPNNNNDSTGTTVNFELAKNEDEYAPHKTESPCESAGVHVKQEPPDCPETNPPATHPMDVTIKQEPQSPPVLVKEEPVDNYQYTNYAVPNEDDSSSSSSSDNEETDTASEFTPKKIKQEPLDDIPRNVPESTAPSTVPNTSISSTSSSASTEPKASETATTKTSPVIFQQVVKTAPGVTPTKMSPPTALGTPSATSKQKITSSPSGQQDFHGLVKDINGKKYIVVSPSGKHLSEALKTPVSKKFSITYYAICGCGHGLWW